MRETFHQRLIELKNGAGLNNRQLAKIANCADSTISRYINGTLVPRIDNFVKIADYFRCSADYLYGIKDDYEEKEYNNCPKFSERLSFLITFLDVSVIQFCIETDISSTVFYHWINNENIPNVHSVFKIANFYDFSMDFILGRE